MAARKTSVRRWMLAAAALVYGGAGHAAATVEMSVVTDWDTVQWFGSVEETRRAIDATVEYTRRLYQEQLGVDVVVTFAEIPASGAADPFSAQQDAKLLLKDVHAHRTSNPSHRRTDVTALFTTRKLNIGSRDLLGIASTGVCSARSSTVVRLQSSGLDGPALAHELAHTIGAHHDGETPCEHEASSGWLMGATITGADHFSQCSLETIKVEMAAGGCFESSAAEATFAAGENERAAPAEGGSGGGGGAFSPMFLLLGALALCARRRVDR
jgi:hypothetical protein